MIDLLGDEIKPERVSEAKRKPTVKKGYAATPGTGPQGETCKTCRHSASLGNYGGKRYSKCMLIKNHWTNGEGTDILMRSPACHRFEKMPEHLRKGGPV